MSKIIVFIVIPFRALFLKSFLLPSAKQYDYRNRDGESGRNEQKNPGTDPFVRLGKRIISICSYIFGLIRGFEIENLFPFPVISQSQGQVIKRRVLRETVPLSFKGF